MRGVNKVMLLGRVGKEPEVVIADEKNPLVRMSIGTTESWKNKEGELQEKTTWHKVSVSGQPACFTRDYIHTGNLVWIEGKNESRSWETDDGEKRYDYSVKALRVENYSPKGSGGNEESEDDIPF
jgi:single-strand DNA-binding protein